MAVLSILKLLTLLRSLDRDCTNWNDFLLDIGTDVKLDSKHKLCSVPYWDKSSRCYEEITSDQKLLHAIDMYWEIRRLSLQVCVIKKMMIMNSCMILGSSRKMCESIDR